MLVKLSTSAIHKIANDPMTPAVDYYLSLARDVRNAYKVPSWIPTSELLANMIFESKGAGISRSYLHKSSPLFKIYGIPWVDKKLSCILYEDERDYAEEWNAYAGINQKLLTL